MCGFSVAGDDGMPVVFDAIAGRHRPESFLVIRSDGESVVPGCATHTTDGRLLGARTSC